MKHKLEYLDKMVDDLQATSSTLKKSLLISDYCEDQSEEAQFAKNILLYTYHPFWQYNVTSANIKKKNALRGQKYSDIFELLDDLKNRVITGHDAIGAVNSFVEQYKEYEDLIHCIIDKDLKTRAGDKIINKAIPGHIPEFNVALADHYESKNVKWKDGWYVSRKIDGVRCIAMVDANGDTKFYSREGKELYTLSIVAGGIKSLGVSNVVFDGEICLVDDNGNEDFQGIMKQIKKKDHTIPNPSFKIFDMISQTEFDSQRGNSDRVFTDRYNDLKEVMRNNTCVCLSVLAQEKIKDDDHFAEWTKKANDYNWEGLMLRADKPYEGKRSKNLLKYKSFNDAEYKVVDVKFGPFRYVSDGRECEEEMLSNVTITHKGHKVDVGSGFTIDERKDFYKNPNKIVGKVITVQYFQETANQNGGISLRFPTVKIIHGDRREV